MTHLALYRKYRSQTFSDLVGQDHVIQTLKKGVATGRIAHAYLFTGPRGTGKTSSARLLAKAVNCPNVVEGEPCGTCEVCVSISDGSAMDVVELDAASESGVDDVREKIVEAVEYKPALFTYRVFIIDEVHDLSAKAFDALLKTIEEPPSHIIFVLATTEFSKVPPTVRSRCQRFEFRRGSLSDLTNRLEFVAKGEGVTYEPSALAAVAKMADGGYRDALTLLEQAILTSDGLITLEHVYNQLGLISEDVSDRILRAMVEGDEKEIITITDQIYRRGRDPRSILESLLYRLSDLTRSIYGVGDQIGDAAAAAGLRSVAGSFGPESLLRFRTSLAEAHRVIRDISLPRIWLEAELMRISRLVRAPAAVALAPAQIQPAREAAKPVAAPSQPAPTKIESPSPEPTKPEPTRVQPARTQTASSSSGGFSQEEKWWDDVLEEAANMSPTARRTLVGTKVFSVQNKMVTVSFDRLPLYESFMEKTKLRMGVLDIWKKKVPDGYTLVFVGDPSSLNMVPTQVATAVELPLDGPRLVEAVKDVFNTDKP